MIKTKKRGSLIVISGPSGAGKDTIIDELLKNNRDVKVAISATTRSPRGKEVDGVNYYFISKEEFEQKINNNDFLEYALYNDNYYGTPKKQVEDLLNNGLDVVLIIEVQGAIKIKNIMEEAIFIFILPPSMDVLRERLESRNTETPDKILKRFKTAYKEINELNKYNYVVVADNPSNASSKVNAIIVSEKCRVDRIEEIDLNTVEEVMHETLVDFKK